MPDYAEAAENKGWKKVGSKWVHPDHPKTHYSPIEIWAEYKDVPTRPFSITPPEPKPVEPKAKKD
jgi:hypothetical protein